MYSISEPRRATVSCKNLSVSSTKNDRSIPPSSSRRHFNNNSNIKRNNNKNNTSFIRSSNHSSKSQRKFIDKHVENLSNSNVFHIPFCVEQTNDNLRKNLIKNNNNKLLRTRLNPLSPVFYSTRQNSLLLEQKENILSSNVHIPILSETSDYSSGTDLELQSTKQNISPQNDSSPFTFDFDERTFSFSIEDINNPISSSMRRMCSSLSLSSSSSSSTSPSSSISNLSSLSSSSECQGNFNNQNRLSNKKILSVNNNKSHNESNDVHNCHCEKLNLSNRKRNRLNSYPIRRLTTIDYCENCQLKRMKFNTRTKYCSNRQQKQRIDNNNNNRYCSTELAPVKFSVDLTGLNVNFTIDYHDSIPCTCSTTVMPYSITNSFNESNNNEFLYYIDTDNHSSWIEQTSPIFNYHDLYFTKLNHTNHISSIYFDDNAIIEAIPTVPSYYVRYMLPSIEIECERNKSHYRKDSSLFSCLFNKLIHGNRNLHAFFSLFII